MIDSQRKQHPLPFSCEWVPCLPITLLCGVLTLGSLHALQISLYAWLLLLICEILQTRIRTCQQNTIMPQSHYQHTIYKRKCQFYSRLFSIYFISDAFVLVLSLFWVDSYEQQACRHRLQKLAKYWLFFAILFWLFCPSNLHISFWQRLITMHTDILTTIINTTIPETTAYY